MNEALEKENWLKEVWGTRRPAACMYEIWINNDLQYHYNAAKTLIYLSFLYNFIHSGFLLFYSDNFSHFFLYQTQ